MSSTALDALRDLGARKVLVVYDHVPRPGESGADLRLAQIVELLREAGHAVTLVGRNADSAPSHARALEERGVRVLAPDPARTPFVKLPARDLELERLVATERFDVAILYQYFWSGLGVGEQYLPLLRAHAPSTRVVLLSDDCHALRERRRFEQSGKRGDLERSRALLAKEADSYRLADALWTITGEDAGRMRAAWPDLDPRVVTFAQADVRQRVPTWSEREGMLFLGSGANDANVQAVRWFAREVLPIVRRALPDATFTLVGEPPPAASGGWNVEDAHTIAAGRADELAPCFDAARVFVSPVTYGTGLKTKNVQALGHGVPFVLTAISAEGLGLEDELARSIADDPRAFAERVIALHEDRALWTRCSERSLAHASARFGRDRTARDLATELASVLARPARAWPAGHVGPSFRVDARFPDLWTGPRRLGERTRAHLTLAREHARGGDLRAAQLEVRMAFADLAFVDREAPAFGDLHAELALYYAATGEHAECVAAAEAAFEGNPTMSAELRASVELARAASKETLANANGLAAFESGDVEKALELQLAAIERTPRDARLWNDLGAMLWSAGDPNEALNAFEKALELVPDDRDASLNRARVLGALGRVDEALSLATTMSTRTPDDAEARELLEQLRVA